MSAFFPENTVDPWTRLGDLGNLDNGAEVRTTPVFGVDPSPSPWARIGCLGNMNNSAELRAGGAKAAGKWRGAIGSHFFTEDEQLAPIAEDR